MFLLVSAPYTKWLPESDKLSVLKFNLQINVFVYLFGFSSQVSEGHQDNEQEPQWILAW